jgi:Ca2+-transporting ATPase
MEGGLTPEEVADRRVRFGRNVLPHDRWAHLRPVISVVKEPMFLLLLATAGVYLALGEMQEAWAMVGALVVVAGIDAVGTVRSNRAVAALARVAARSARVMRDGVVREVRAEELVVDDLVLCEEGKVIPADGEVVESGDCAVNEATMTGESVAVDKRPSDGLLAGTQVVRGSAWMRVTAVGTATAFAGIGVLARSTGKERTPLGIKVHRFVRGMLWAGGAVFVAVWVYYAWESGSVLHGLLHGLTLAMSVLPEEVPVALSTFLALGAYRMLRHGIIARTPATVETLGSATVLAVDKTGTLTLNRMDLVDTLDADPEFPAWKWAFFASEPEPFDPMEQSLHARFRAEGGDAAGFALVQEYPLSGMPPVMTHVFRHADGRQVIACKGAPEGVLALCAGLGAEARAQAAAEAARLAREGLRVLGVARVPAWDGVFPERQEEWPFEWVGLVAFSDPVAPGIPEALAGLRGAGLRTVMITGDAPETAGAVARQVGIRAERIVTGPEWAAMGEEERVAALRAADVFARIRPEAKLQIVTALTASGAIVAMTGDGVNDAPALRAAHIGIALGRRGTEVAHAAAGLVLVEDDLATLLPALLIGRRINANLRKAIGYVVAIHVPILALVVAPLLVPGLPAMLLAPLHVVFLELLMGPTCSLAFEREPTSDAEVARPWPVTGGLLGPGALGAVLIQGFALSLGCIAAALLAARVTGSPTDETVRTAAFTALVVGNAVLTRVARSRTEPAWSTHFRPNSWMAAAFVVPLLLCALLVAVPGLRDAFGLTVLPASGLLLAILLGAVSALAYEPFKRAHRAG